MIEETFEEFLREAMKQHPDAAATVWRLADEAIRDAKMIEMRNLGGELISPATAEEIKQIREYAEAMFKPDGDCNDHPCEFIWAENCLKLIGAIDKLTNP